MTYHKFSKQLTASFVGFKQNMVDNNASLIKYNEEINHMLEKSPMRDFCKICKSPVSNDLDFVSHGVKYIRCGHCSHIQTLHDDSAQFLEWLYSSSDGKNYSFNYTLDEFLNRTNEIYAPKLNFLTETLNFKGETKSLSIQDNGCGAGFFVASALQQNIESCGFEISPTLVEGAKKAFNQLNLDPEKINLINDESELLQLVETSSSLCQSFIGVLEHLSSPTNAIQSFLKSSSVYLYGSVPMFGLSAISQVLSPNVFPRVLGGPHTHVFTTKSLATFLKDLEIVGTWSFGSDIFDLFRTISVSHAQNRTSSRFREAIQHDIFNLNTINDIQKTIDRINLASEIHFIAKKK